MDPTGKSRDPILAGQPVSATDSPILYLSGPEGACTATLIAPTLVVTARHCVAKTTDGQFSCTPAGDLVMPGNLAGQIGSNDAPDQLDFFTNLQVVNGTVLSPGIPDAVGSQIISTNTLTACKDDLAFVVLNQPISGIVPAAVRIDSPTVTGETVSMWGYGLTEEASATNALRVRANAQIVGVGPDTPMNTVQLAPVRAVRLGPDDITCNGDSGGPITSAATGAVIAVASLGNEANWASPTCSNFGNPDTTGPRLAAYRSLTLLAFSAAGATPVPEYGADAAPVSDAAPDEAAAAEAGDALPPVQTQVAAAGGCSITRREHTDRLSRDGATAALAATAFMWRRRR